MFDIVSINGVEYEIFFDKKNMKCYIKFIYKKDVMEYIQKNRFIKIHRHLLYLAEYGHYNEGNHVYDVLYYLEFQYDEFMLSDLKYIRFESKKISELFYNKSRKTKKLSYDINNGDESFILNIVSSNKLENKIFYELNNASNMTIDIIKCSTYEGLDRIIKGALNLLAIIAVDIDIKNCNIYIEKKDKHRGNIVFNRFIQKEKYININFSMGNLWFLEKYIPNILNTIYNSPNLNLYFLSCFQLEYDNYDFFNIYSCYEYEYSKIDKEKIHKLKYISEINKEKNAALSMLKKGKFSDKFKSYVANFNPLEGHKQKLKNGLTYIRFIMSIKYSDSEFEEFINKIYKLRTDIVHNPSGHFVIDDIDLISSFSQAVYILLLKRCGINSRTIKKAVDEFFVRYI